MRSFGILYHNVTIDTDLTYDVEIKIEIMDEKDPIIRFYRTITNDDNFSVLEVELVTGKTHQIRAHLSHVGYPILGDEKYGNSEINKQQGKRFQCLCAYKLVFGFDDKSYLYRLNKMVVELEKKDIKFL